MNPLNTQRTHCIEYVGEFYAGPVLRLAVKLCHVKCTAGRAMQMNLVVKFIASQALKLPSMHLLGCSSICKKDINLHDIDLTYFECLPFFEALPTCVFEYESEYVICHSVTHGKAVGYFCQRVFSEEDVPLCVHLL